MIERVERLPRPDPDVGRLLTALLGGKPDRVPLLEIKLDPEVTTALLGEDLMPWRKDASSAERLRAIRQHSDLWRRLGYDAYRLRAPVHLPNHRLRAGDTAALSRGEREWQDEHSGPIATLADVESYPWPRPQDLDFTQAEEAVRDVPDGMACIGYSSGVFEWGNWLTGLERFLLAPYDDAELLREVTRRVGELVLTAFKAFCSMDGIVALWLGDDLGFKTTTLMSPDHTREFILPWYRRYADLAHEHGMPFILHTCGEVRPVMDDLAETAGIDAKHSFEDVIQPVEEFHRDWSADVAAVGGVDMDLLAQGSEDAVAARTTEILTACAPRGAYVAGSGNSIANYVPVGNYLAMVEAVHRFNGRL